MPLPSFPIGTQPFGMSVAEASKQRGIELFFLLIIVFLVIEDEDANKCNPLLTTFLDSLVLIGVATIVAGQATPCPQNTNPQPNCPGKCDAAETAVYTKFYEVAEEPDAEAEPETDEAREEWQVTAASAEPSVSE